MLARLFTKDAVEERAVPIASYGVGGYGGWAYGNSPVSVSTNTALGYDVSSACIDVLAGSISTTPIDVVRVQGPVRIPVDPPSLIANPSALVESDVWLYQLVDSMLTDGNGFGMVVATDAAQRPTQIELLDPDIVSDRIVDKGVPQAMVDNKRHKVYPHGDLWHVPGKYPRAKNSPFADNVIDRASASIGLAIAARNHAVDYFNAGGMPIAVAYSDQELDSPQAAAIKASIVNAMRGSREPLVLGSGLRLEAPPTSLEGAQVSGITQIAVEAACRYWRVPPSMVYAAISGQNITYANVTQADLHYMKHSLGWLFRRLEKALSRLLPGMQTVRFNRNAFLQSDPQGRHELYDLRLRNKTTSIAEVRALEDEPPFDGREFYAPGIPGDPTPPAPEGDD
jgi:HK97 family phage portal protein